MFSKITRRSFIGASASATSLLAADRLFGERGPAATTPATDLEKLGEVAVGEAKKHGASYADVRIGRYRNQFSGYRLSPERGSNITNEVPFVTDQNSFGFGVRVIVQGQWGFAASPLVTAEEIARITREAITVAEANAAAQANPVQLAPVKAYRDRWTSKFDRDPFSVPMDEKLELIHAATLSAKKDSKVFSAWGALGFLAEDSTLHRRTDRPFSNTLSAFIRCLKPRRWISRTVSRERAATPWSRKQRVGRRSPKPIYWKTRRVSGRRCWNIWRRRP